MQFSNVVCIVAYDGSKFCGFSHQKNSKGLLSVADFFEGVLKKIGISAKIIGSGRTDKFVHATNQVINFHTKLHMPLQKMQVLLNDRLYPFVFVKKIFLADSNFHARFSAKMRFYRYICTQSELLPFYTAYIARVRHGGVHLVQTALNEFIGTHDFSLFKKNGSETKNYIRTITKAHAFHAKIHNIECLVVNIGANGFLRSQVRMMLKACFEFSLGKITLENLKRQIQNDDALTQKACVRTLAPACGLYLSRVLYS